MKKTICVLFAAVLTLNLFVPAYADGLTKGTFTYLPAFGEATEETYYYTDAFFEKSGKEDDGHLLVMSFDLAAATFGVGNPSYVMKLLDDIGFEDVSIADLLEKPDRNTVGTAIAHKSVGGKNLIAVAIRGGKYDGEWASDVIVGKTGNAKGFDDAAKKTLGRLKDYIAENGLENNKIWITGYSRAGAIADLAGVYINNNPEEFGVSADDLYVFAFEPPACSVDDTVYDNIHIVINKNDIVPFVCPASWGLHTNGRILTVGADHSVMTYVGLLGAEEYRIEEQSALLSDAIGWLADRLPRETYAENLEGPLADLLEIFFGKSAEDRSKILAFFTEDALGALLDGEYRSELIGLAWSVMSHESDYLYHELTDLLTAVLDSVRGTENAAALTDAEYETVKNSLYPILRTAGPVLVDDMIWFEGIDYDSYYANELPYMKMDDRVMGEATGADRGFENGYLAGFEGGGYDDSIDAIGDLDEYGPDYEAGCRNTYFSAYAEGYALGLAHAADLAEKGAYDGARDGERNGYSEGNARVERVPHNEYFWEEDWMTGEYVAAYDNAYEKAYNPAYDRGLADPEATDPPTALDSYHILSVAKNISAILTNHYPQVNLALVKLAGHDVEITSSAEATCYEDGFTAYRCPECGDEFVISVPGGHKLSRFAAVKPTAEQDGCVEYRKCEVCGKCFSDENGEEQIEPESVILKLGDVNRDGALNARDVIAIMDHILGAADDDFDAELADYNDDYRVNARDVIAVMKAIAAGK